MGIFGFVGFGVKLGRNQRQPWENDLTDGGFKKWFREKIGNAVPCSTIPQNLSSGDTYTLVGYGSVKRPKSLLVLTNTLYHLYTDNGPVDFDPQELGVNPLDVEHLITMCDEHRIIYTNEPQWYLGRYLGVL